jgi:phosphatidate cytidylyltransferase
VNWNTFFTRTGTALVFAIVMLIGLLGQPIFFFALLLLIQFLSIKEYFFLLSKINPSEQYSVLLQATVQLLGMAALLLMANILDINRAAFALLLFIPVLILLREGLSERGTINKAFQSFGGILYISLPIAMLMLMREKSLLLPLGLILLIWINDTMAYIVGSFIGKTPFSKISPNKTWEGTIGGGILTLLAAATWGFYSPYYTMQDWMALSLCASLAGTLGDLFESKLKRLAAVKDSGSFMPGHGGALDRFDSLLVATPFAFAYSYLFMGPLTIHVF